MTSRIAATRREVLAGASAVIAAPFAGAAAQTRIVMNDASRLNPTPTFRHWTVAETGEARIALLRKALKEAAAARQPVVVGAARHSMGAQSLARDGLAISFPETAIEPDTANAVYRTPAGMRWHDVIAQLDRIGFSPAVMQSNADFGVGATFSVNAHGWPVPYGPFGSTVRSLRLMLASGDIVECSREKNAELFRLAMGGYGLVGIILDLDVAMVKNLYLQRTALMVPPEEFGERFVQAVRDRKNLMAYGRLSVERARFFHEALMITYAAAPTQPAPLPPVAYKSAMTGVSRKIYRAQVGHEYGKKARWIAETVLDPKVASGLATRNSLMAEPVANLANTDMKRTDILHEYFVPPARFADFVAACRRIIPQAKAEFLNVTLRYVAPDPDSILAFAPQERIAAVMSFSQTTNPEGEIDMLQTTERLIDAVAGLGGAFYLPYRLHARRDQVRACYRSADAFAEAKRKHDPGLLFRHAMWDAYFA